MENIITFTSVKLPFGWMGNMSPYQITYKDKIYRTTEALFQSLRFNDENIKEQIRLEKSPFSAKIISKKFKDKVSIVPQSEKDINNMRLCLRLKLYQHPELKQMLIETGDKLIYENATLRKNEKNSFWGAKLINGQWRGNNMLGKLWVELRNEIKNNLQ